MKKRFTISVLMVLFLGTIAFSQPTSNWKFSRVILSGSGHGTDGCLHGIAVAPDGCIWVNLYRGIEDYPDAPNGSDLVLNPDGSLKAILSEAANDGAGRGMSLGHDGKIYSSHYDVFNVYDYQTMEVERKIVPKANTSLTTPVADEFGNILVGFVYLGGTSGNGVYNYNANGEFLGIVINPTTTNLPGLSRDIAITPDGNDLYIANLSSGFGVGHWHSADGAFGGGTYTFVEYIGGVTETGLPKMYGGTGQVVKFDQKGRLWVGFDGTMEPSRYDCWDLDKNEIVDCIVSFPNPNDMDGLYIGNDDIPDECWVQGGFVTPRGFAMSNDGKKAYVVDYNSGILEFDYVEPSDAKEPKAVPEGFALSQNYPNPFNPSTNFTYSVPNTTDVRIAIYDLFGREIKTLVNESKEAGTYNITWNGRDSHNRQVATGVYFYKMQATGFEKTMKMMIVK